MKKFLDNKFWEQGNLPVNIYWTKDSKNEGETKLSLILLTIQPIQKNFVKY